MQLATDQLVERELGKSDAIRWAVGSYTGLRSSTWRFWGNKKGDFYLSVRILGGSLKTSLHRDRNCQTGFTKDYAREAGLKRSRHLDRWQLADAPLVIAVQVVIPVGELDRFEAKEAEPMVWVPIPPVEFVSVVTVYILRPDYSSENNDQWPGQSHGTQPLGVIRTPLRAAFVAWSQQPLTENVREFIERHRTQISSSAKALKVLAAPSIRSAIFGQQGDEPRFLMELAFRG
jgi:hypothetical protein